MRSHMEQQHPTLEEKTKILVVDDEKDSVLMMKEFLEAVGYQVYTAHNGQEALEELERVGIDLILTDLYMPEMNGMELLGEVKRRGLSIPVVLITGYPSIDVAVEAMKEGASDFILKPIKLDQIELTIKKFTGKPKNPKSSEETGQDLDTALNKKIKELFALYSISDAMSQVLDLDSLFKKIVWTGAEIAGAKTSSLMTWDRIHEKLTVKAVTHLDQKTTAEQAETLIEEVASLTAKEARGIKTASMISVPLMIKGKVFGVLNVCHKIDGGAFSQEDLFLMQLLAQKAALNIENILLYERNYQSLLETLKALIMTIDAKDSYTRAHSERVTQYSLNIADELNCTQEEKDVIKFAAFLHDIGKVGIPDSILLKPGSLTDREFSTIKTHTITGENIVMPLGLLPQERWLIRSHHERIDGSGYPDGLKGKEIPLLACILAVADSYDAMTSDRPYRKAKSHVEAMSELEAMSNIKYHEDVVRAFKKTFS